MSFTDFFIRRPVLTTAFALLIALVGLRALLDLPLRQYPRIESAVVTVTTEYPGASADLMQGFVTTTLAQAVATTQGVEYLTSSSDQGRSTINAYLRLNADSDTALTEVLAKVNEVRYLLPDDAYDPVVQRQSPGAIGVVYAGFTAPEGQPLTGITDYLMRVARPMLTTVDGVAAVNVLGAQALSMRIWLDPLRMGAHGITTADVESALRDNNYQAAPGQLRDALVVSNVRADTSLDSVQGFRELVVKRGISLVRLEDIATVEIGAQNRNQIAGMNGEPAVYLEVMATPGGNPLTISREARRILNGLDLPAGAKMAIPYDVTVFIDAAIGNVLGKFGIASLEVVLVIFIFLGSLRAVAVPVLSIPLSLLGAAAIMLALGYSLNLLTLLAMVLAIGLVVDDAIVVVENVHRRMEEGESPRDAAIHGAREIVGPVLTMAATLVAVYAPLGLIGGLTGALFSEFAFTLAAAVTVSAVVALTVSPMVASKLLRRQAPSRYAVAVEHATARLVGAYDRLLGRMLRDTRLTLLIGAGVLASLPILFNGLQSELVPAEDQGEIIVDMKAPQASSLEFLEGEAKRVEAALRALPEAANVYMVSGMGGALNKGWAGVMLTPWADRQRDAAAIMADLQGALPGVEGIAGSAFLPAPLPGSVGGFPVQFVVSSPAGHQAVYETMEKVKDAARRSGKFAFVDSDLIFSNPTTLVRIDRSRAHDLGLSMKEIGDTLARLVGESYVNRFGAQGRSYDVIPQAPRHLRLTAESLDLFHVRTATGGQVPLSTVVSLENGVEANALTQFNQLNSATLVAVPAPGVPLGQAVAFLQGEADRLPAGFQTSFLGESRQYLQEQGGFALTFAFALVFIFLVLAAQFESARDPLLILTTVPLAACGALAAMFFGLGTLNIYTQIGLVTLIGLITKHGILIVEFANVEQRTKGLDRVQAVRAAAATRIRPILMTTAAMVGGLMPLLFANGAGAGSQRAIATVLVAGLLVGTLFTLFVLPAVYARFGRDLAGATAAGQPGHTVAPTPALPGNP
ncbi:efflux RND transporter permease subunit [Achromobacter sp. UMC46]|uniref:efflux RND transporter permease subunit n=1 Tax=Achromobacter sp. UMC46 TaxID=1862319 RepID=UPI00210731E2|nr:efflux RND transporter permease subunit [Achromobacter sp. UMC46]MBB1593332.1 acriflavine resistance protein B [Achromobacter sp. UMC46]